MNRLARFAALLVLFCAAAVAPVARAQTGPSASPPPASAAPPPVSPPPAARPAGSDDLEREARRLAMEGMRRFNVGDYREAIAAYKASYLLVPAPGLLYNLAQAHRLWRHCSEAVSLYRQVLSSTAGDELRGMAADRLKEIEPCPPPPVADVPAPSPPPPGSLSRDLTIRVPAPPPAPPRWRRLPVVGTGAGALALAATSFYFARQAKDDGDRVSALFKSGGAWNSDYGAIDQAGMRHQRYATAAAAGSLVLAGLAVWLALRDGDHGGGAGARKP